LPPRGAIADGAWFCLRHTCATHTIAAMAFAIERDERRRWIIVRASGGFTLSEVLTLIATARADVEHRMWPMLVADDDALYSRMFLYEARCADIGVRVIRVFRQRPDAEYWLETVSAARHFG
jgi:hypothetical protein